MAIKPLLTTEHVAAESVENAFVNKLINKLSIWSTNSFIITQESIGILKGELYKMDIMLKRNNKIKNIVTLKETLLTLQKSITLEIRIIIRQIDLSREIFVQTQILEKLEQLSLTLKDFREVPETYLQITEELNIIFSSIDNKDKLSLFLVQFNAIYISLTDDINSKTDASILVEELINDLRAHITKKEFQLDNLYLVFRQKRMAALLQQMIELIKRLKNTFNTGSKIYSKNYVFRTFLEFILSIDINIAADNSVKKISSIILDLKDLLDTIPAGSEINGLELILKTAVEKLQIIQSEIDPSTQIQLVIDDENILREIEKVLTRIIDECADDLLDSLYTDLDKSDYHPVLIEFYTLTEKNIKYNIKTLLNFLEFEENFKIVLVEEKNIAGLHNFKLDVKKQLMLIENLIPKRMKYLDRNQVTLVAGHILKTVDGITRLLPVHDLITMKRMIGFNKNKETHVVRQVSNIIEGITRLLAVHNTSVVKENLEFNAVMKLKNTLLVTDVNKITVDEIVKINSFVKAINITTENDIKILHTDLSSLSEPLYLFKKKLKETIRFENKFKIEEIKTKTLHSTKKSNEAANKILLNINENKKFTSCLTNEYTQFKTNINHVFQTSAFINEKLNTISKIVSQNEKSLTITMKWKEIGSAFAKFRSFVQDLSQKKIIVINRGNRASHFSVIDGFKKIIDAARGVAKGNTDVTLNIVSVIDELVINPVSVTLLINKDVIFGIIDVFDNAINIMNENIIFQQGIITTRDLVFVTQDAANILFDFKKKIVDLIGFNITINTLETIQDIEIIANIWSKGISFITIEDVRKCQSYMIELQNIQQGNIEFDFSSLFNTVDNITTSITNDLITQSLFTHTYDISKKFKANSVTKALGDALALMIQKTQNFDLATQCLNMLETSLSMFTDLENIIDGNVTENESNDEAVNLIINIYEILRTVSIDINSFDISDITDFARLLGKLDPFTNVTKTGVLHFDRNRFIQIKTFLQQIQLSINETYQNITDFVEASREVLIQKRASTEIEALTLTLKDWINILSKKKSDIEIKIDDTSQEIFNEITDFIIKWGFNGNDITKDDIFEFETLFKKIKFLELFPAHVIKGFNLWKVYLLNAPVTLLQLLQRGGPLAANTYLVSDKLQLLKFTEAKQVLKKFIVQTQSLFDSLTVGTDIDVEDYENFNTLIKNAISTSEKWNAGLIENFHIKGFKQLEKEFNFLSLKLNNVSRDMITSLESLISSLNNSLAKIDTFIENINNQISDIKIDVYLDDAFNIFSHIKYFVNDLVSRTDSSSAEIITISHFHNVVTTLKNLSSDYLDIDVEQIDLNPLKDAWKGAIKAIINVTIEKGMKIENLMEINKLIHSYTFSLENRIIKNKYNKINSITENFSFKTLCPLLGNCSKDNILLVNKNIAEIFKYLSHLEKDIYDIEIDQIRSLSSMDGILLHIVSSFGGRILYLDDITKALANIRTQIRKYQIVHNLHFEWKRRFEIFVDTSGQIERLETSLRDLQFNIGGLNNDTIIEENENITNIFNQIQNFTSYSFSMPLFLNDILKGFDLKLTNYTQGTGILHLNEAVQLLGHLKKIKETSESLVNEFDFLDSILKAEAVTFKLLETITDFKVSYRDDKMAMKTETDSKTEMLPNLVLIIKPLKDIQEKMTENDIDELKIAAAAYFSLPINRISEIKDITHLIFQLSQVSTHFHTLSSSLEISIQAKLDHAKLKEVLETRIRLHSFIGKNGSSEVTTIIAEIEELLDRCLPQINYETVDQFKFLVNQLGSAINAGREITVESNKITKHLFYLKPYIFKKLQTTSLLIANSKKITELRDIKSKSSLINDHANFGLTYLYDTKSKIVENVLKELLVSLNNLTEYETINGGLSYENSSVLLKINDFLNSFQTTASTFTFGITEHLTDILKIIKNDTAGTPVNSIILDSLIVSVTEALKLLNDTQTLHTDSGYTESVTQFLEFENVVLVLKDFTKIFKNIDEIINEEGTFITNISTSLKDIEVYKQISENLFEIAFEPNLIHENTILNLNLNLEILSEYKFVPGEKINGISLWKHYLFDSEDNLRNIIENIYYKPSFTLAKIHQTINKFSHASQVLNRYLLVIKKIDNIVDVTNITAELLHDDFVNYDVTQRIYGLFELSLETLQNWNILLDMNPFEINIIETSYKTIDQLIRALKGNPFTKEADEITVDFVTVKSNMINAIKYNLDEIEVAIKKLFDYSEEIKEKNHISEDIISLKQLKNIVLFLKEKIDCELYSNNTVAICNLTVNVENVTKHLDEQSFMENYENVHNLIVSFAKNIGLFIDDIESACSLPLVITTNVTTENQDEGMIKIDCISNLMTDLDSIPGKCETVIENLEEMLDNFEFSVDISSYLKLEN